MMTILITRRGWSLLSWGCGHARSGGLAGDGVDACMRAAVCAGGVVLGGGAGVDI